MSPVNAGIMAGYRMLAAKAILREKIRRGEYLEPHQVRAAVRFGLLKG